VAGVDIKDAPAGKRIKESAATRTSRSAKTRLRQIDKHDRRFHDAKHHDRRNRVFAK